MYIPEMSCRWLAPTTSLLFKGLRTCLVSASLLFEEAEICAAPRVSKILESMKRRNRGRDPEIFQVTGELPLWRDLLEPQTLPTSPFFRIHTPWGL